MVWVSGIRFMSPWFKCVDAIADERGEQTDMAERGPQDAQLGLADRAGPKNGRNLGDRAAASDQMGDDLCHPEEIAVCDGEIENLRTAIDPEAAGIGP